ncbi:MAG: hypothetical protein VW362_08355 [Candidatus Nanopelagicales bacterium]
MEQAIKAAGVPITGLSIGDVRQRGTWRVQPASLQAQAQPIIDAFDPNDPALAHAEVTEQAQATSRQKDILATCALIVRARNLTAWNGMTTAQKVAAARAEADTWRDMRIWAETNL